MINIINIKKYKDLIKSVIANIIKENGINTFGTQAMFFLEMFLKDNSKFILFIDPSQSKLEELPEEINEIAINEKLTGKFIFPYINSQHNVLIVLDINQSNQLDNIEILDSLQSSFKDIEYYRPFIGFFNSQSQNSAKDKIKFINSSKNERFQSNKKTANSCYFLSAQSTEYLCDMLEEIEKTDKKIEMVDKSTQTYKFDIAQMQEKIVNRLNEYREYGINIRFENYELLDYSEANRPSAVATHGSEFLPQTNMFKVPNKAKPKKSEEKLDNRNKLVNSIIQKHQDTNKSSLEMVIQREYDKNSSQSD